MSGIRSLASLKKNITGTVRYNDTSFIFTIFPNPHKKTETEQRDIIRLFGNRIQKDTRCLNITEEEVQQNIRNKNYTALIYVKNVEIDDTATGALQYWNWCDKNTSNRQLWINDLCRVNNSTIHNTSPTSPTSPILILFDIIKKFSLEKHINSNYLMVETEKPSTSKLIEIYTKYDFRVDDTCTQEGNIIMKRSLRNSGGTRKTRKHTK